MKKLQVHAKDLIVVIILIPSLMVILACVQNNKLDTLRKQIEKDFGVSIVISSDWDELVKREGGVVIEVKEYLKNIPAAIFVAWNRDQSDRFIFMNKDFKERFKNDRELLLAHELGHIVIQFEVGRVLPIEKKGSLTHITICLSDSLSQWCADTR